MFDDAHKVSSIRLFESDSAYQSNISVYAATSTHSVMFSNLF